MRKSRLTPGQTLCAYMDLRGVERCMLTISRVIDTQSRTQIWQIWALGLLALLTGKSAMVDTSLRDANMD